MFAAVDLGSNSFRLHIGEPEGTKMRIVRSARQPIRLAAGLDKDNMLTEAAMQRALRCLEDFSAILKEQKLDGVRVVATNTLRVAKNAEAFLPLAESAIGYPIEIISGEEEGRLIYMGVARALGGASERRLVIDIGGGSTEIVLGDGAEVRAAESFTIGAYPQSAAFFPGGQLTMRAFDAAVNAARACFEDAAEGYRAHAWDASYGSSGTIRAIAEVIAKNGIGDGTLSHGSLLALRDRLVGFGDVDAFNLPGIKQERVPVMVGGLTVLIGVLQELGIERMGAINAGLRLGVLSDLELRANRHDRRDEAILACMRRFGVDEQRARRTAAMARQLYARLAPQAAALAPYLEWSAMLHEVGQSVSHSGAHKHAAYIVEHADLPGFTTREQRTMATLVAGHKGNLRKIRDTLADPDLAKAVLALRLAVVFMHAKIGDTDIGGLKLQMKSRIEIEAPRDWIAGHPTVSCWLDKEREAWTEVDRPFSVRLV
jgi:exopolyphosphatase/guanosine-5'-triphosphate,3'-diphosphate pyrophosphatase